MFGPLLDTHENYIMYAPEAENGAWNTGSTLAPVSSDATDVDYVNELVTLAKSDPQQRWPINDEKVYVVGYGNGGSMAQKFACSAPGTGVAAIGAVSGGLSDAAVTANDCETSSLFSVLLVSGDADPEFPWAGASPYQGIRTTTETVLTWEDKMGCCPSLVADGSAGTGTPPEANCSAYPVPQALPDVDAGDGSTVTFTQAVNCSNSREFAYYRVVGGQHNWPGQPGGNMDIDASVTLWAWFDAHPLNGPCSDDICNGRGTCVSTTKCSCNEGFTGDLCQDEVNECTDVDCGNGVCEVVSGDPVTTKCHCNEGWKGPTCLEDAWDYFRQRMFEGGAPPNGVVAVYRNVSGALPSYNMSMGSSSLETPVEMLDGGRWISASTIMRVVQAGLMTLDDTPGDYLAWWTAPTSDPRANITLRMLLSDTSGLDISAPDCYTFTGAGGGGAASVDACAQAIYDHFGPAQSGMAILPGSQFFYSSANLQVAGAMAMQAAGQATWQALFDFYVGTPLGFDTSTATYGPSEALPSVAEGLIITGYDFTKWFEAYYVDGTLLEPQWVAAMETDHTPDGPGVIGYSPLQAAGFESHYALGNFLDCRSSVWLERCAEFNQHSAMGQRWAYTYIDRELGFGLYMLTQDGSQGQQSQLSQLTGDLASRAADALGVARGEQCDYSNGDPCSGHGSCQEPYGCDCSPEWKGTSCDVPKDPCMVLVCHNGGTCDAESGVCHCDTGFSGDNCDTYNDPCDGITCGANAQCNPDTSSCECVPGFTGANCDQPNSCATVPAGTCANGGTCVDDSPAGGGGAGSAGYSCHCAEFCSGDFCETCIDPCDGVQCAANATCAGGACNCNDPAWEGPDCNTAKPDECVTAGHIECANGGTCVNDYPGTHCACAVGWEPPVCGEPTPLDCDSTPCVNGGTCINGPDPYDGAYSCNCTDDFSGDTCQTPDADYCTGDPCQNGATCENGDDTHTCHCVTGWTGPTCAEDINECASTPCQNGGICSQPAVGQYHCDCPQGWEGDDCETPFDYCAGPPPPCQNGGACSNTPAGFLCNCTGTGKAGLRCEYDEGDPCRSEQCQNDATCEATGTGDDDFTCHCDGGFEGRYCEDITDWCTHPDMRCGHGTCNSIPGNYTCACNPGWEGFYCDRDRNECLTISCFNGGTCVNDIGSFHCDCVHGYGGTECLDVINYCEPAPCKNGATCQQHLGGYSCDCAPGWTDANCTVSIDDCETGGAGPLCVNGGTCVDGYLNYTCSCAAGWYGRHCEAEIDECGRAAAAAAGGAVCLNGGTCVDLLDGLRCDCVTGYDGDHCETNIDDCDPNPCSNGGTCQDGVDTFTCHCATGWEGPLCADDEVECTPATCNHDHGTCVEGLGGHNNVTCDCAPGYAGPRCQTTVNGCTLGFCKNGAFCNPLPGGAYACDCSAGWEGTNCDVEKNECDPEPCQNGGTCVDYVGYYSCLCPNGWYGVTCADDVDECAGAPCENGGTCVQPSVGQYSCECRAHFTGDDCEISPCADVYCGDHGQCQTTDADPAFCACSGGWSGPACEYNPECSDGAKNGDESDVDCGGPANDGCARCGAGFTCAALADCASSTLCTANALCTDERMANSFHYVEGSVSLPGVAKHAFVGDYVHSFSAALAQAVDVAGVTAASVVIKQVQAGDGATVIHFVVIMPAGYTPEPAQSGSGSNSGTSTGSGSGSTGPADQLSAALSAKITDAGAGGLASMLAEQDPPMVITAPAAVATPVESGAHVGGELAVIAAGPGAGQQTRPGGQGSPDDGGGGSAGIIAGVIVLCVLAIGGGFGVYKLWKTSKANKFNDSDSEGEDIGLVDDEGAATVVRMGGGATATVNPALARSASGKGLGGSGVAASSHRHAARGTRAAAVGRTRGRGGSASAAGSRRQSAAATAEARKARTQRVRRASVSRTAAGQDGATGSGASGRGGDDSGAAVELASITPQVDRRERMRRMSAVGTGRAGSPSTTPLVSDTGTPAPESPGGAV